VRAIIESGVNVVTSLYQLAGTGCDDDAHDRVLAASERGNASLYASGTHPGYAPMVALTATSVCSRIECVSMLESVDS